MRELLQILQQAKQLSDADRGFALATVVKIGGSTYRRPGARMLVSDAGERWGALSGGCLEGEVAQQALEVIATENLNSSPLTWLRMILSSDLERDATASCMY